MTVGCDRDEACVSVPSDLTDSNVPSDVTDRKTTQTPRGMSRVFLQLTGIGRQNMYG